MRAALLLVPLAACGPKGELTVTPTDIAWGEIDFQQELPATGYAPQNIALVNQGDDDLVVTVRAFDDERLLLGALLDAEDPPTLTPIPPLQTVVITVGVKAYLEGERDTLVEGSFEFASDDLKEPVPVTWSFTPIRVIGGDTGT